MNTQFKFPIQARRCVHCIPLLFIAALISTPTKASTTYNITFDTSALQGQPAAPYSLDFQFADGSGLGDGNNTVTLSDFQFGGGSATGTANVFGGALGDLLGGVTFTDSAFFSELFQTFTPGSSLTFMLTLSNNADAPAPDQFSFALLDNLLNNVPTQGPGDVLLIADITSTGPIIQTFAPITVTQGGTTSLLAQAPQASQVPEPKTFLLIGTGLIALALVRWNSRRIGAGCVLLLSGGFLHAQTNATVPPTIIQSASIPSGTMPIALAVNPATNRIYVVNKGSNNLGVIDGNTNNIVYVNTGSTPVAVVVNTVTNRIYVANSGGTTVTAVDGASNNTSPITVGNGPIALAMNPATNRIYALNSDSTVSVIDGAANQSIDTVTVAGGSTSLALNPVTNKIYTAAVAGVTVIDGANDSTLTIPLAGIPIALAVNPITNTVYEVNHTGAINAIDGDTNAITAITLPVSVAGVAINPVTNKIYAQGTQDALAIYDPVANTSAKIITNNQIGSARGVAIDTAANRIYMSLNIGSTPLSAAVAVVDGATNTTVVVPTTGMRPSAIAVNPITHKVYVANQTTGDVSVIDGTTDLGSTTLYNGERFTSAALNPITNKIYLTSSATNSLVIVDGVTKSSSSVPVGTNPSAVAVNAFTNRVYVANKGSNNVTVVDRQTSQVTTVPVGAAPVALAVNPVTNVAYVVNSGTNNVTVIGPANDVVATVNTDASPGGLAINTVTNKIYVYNTNGASVTVIDGATNQPTSVTIGTNPTAIGVNAVTNKIYVAEFNDIAVIDGVTNTPTFVPNISATALDINPLTNKVYLAVVAGLGVLDGATNTVTNVSFPAASYFIAVNPTSNTIYARDLGQRVNIVDGTSNSVRSVAIAGIGGMAVVNPITNIVYVTQGSGLTTLKQAEITSIPLQAAIGQLTGNVTSNAAQAFAFSPATAFAPTAPAIDGVYFQVDTVSGNWTRVSPMNGSYNGTTPALAPGVHTVFAYATDGQDSATVMSGGLSGPLAGNVATYQFLVLPAQPAADVTAQVSITRGGFSYSRTLHQFVQNVTITNTSGAPIDGPLSLVLDGLSNNATLANPDGHTAALAPAGAPYVNVAAGAGNAVEAGQSVSVTLYFVDPSMTGITYSTRVIAGTGTR